MTSIVNIQNMLANRILHAKFSSKSKNAQKSALAWEEVEELSEALYLKKANRDRTIAYKKTDLDAFDECITFDTYCFENPKAKECESIETFCKKFPEADDCKVYDV